MRVEGSLSQLLGGQEEPPEGISDIEQAGLRETGWQREARPSAGSPWVGEGLLVEEGQTAVVRPWEPQRGSPMGCQGEPRKPSPAPA